MLDRLHEAILWEHFPAGSALSGLVLPHGGILELVTALVQHRVSRHGHGSHGVRSLLVHLTRVLRRLVGRPRGLRLLSVLTLMLLLLVLVLEETTLVGLGHLSGLLLLSLTLNPRLHFCVIIDVHVAEVLNLILLLLILGAVLTSLASLLPSVGLLAVPLLE